MAERFLKSGTIQISEKRSMNISEKLTMFFFENPNNLKNLTEISKPESPSDQKRDGVYLAHRLIGRGGDALAKPRV